MQNQIEQFIRQLIIAQGTIGIDEFMKIVVNHYYNSKDVFGVNGDFTTAVEISQMFGEMIGVWVAQKFLNRKFPDNKFNLIEIGPGRGTMMADILRAIKRVPNLPNALEKIILIEKSDFLKTKQQQVLSQYNNKTIWYDDLKVPNNYPNIIVCNELFDSLPIKQYKKINGVLKEIRIGLVNNKLEFILSTQANGVQDNYSPEQGIIEYSPAANLLAKQMAHFLQHNDGAALIIDYGYQKPTYKSTLQALKQHKYHSIFSDIGQADITAHVDFATLGQWFAKHNLATKITTQKEFLLNMGIELRGQTLINNGADAEDIRLQIERLTSASLMGELFLALEVVNFIKI